MKLFRFLIPLLFMLSIAIFLRAEIIEKGIIHKKINENLYILKSKNYNTNVGVFLGKQSIVLIDPMTGNDNHQNLLDAIREFSDRPIKYVINTHSHMDHSGANLFFKEMGATIISHENAKYSQADYQVTFKENYTLEVGEETIKLFHFNAHTMDDALVYFEKNNVIFLGDNYMDNWLPHFFAGGSSGHLKIINEAISLSDNQSQIIPAHGSLSTNKKALASYKENIIQWVERISYLNEKGQTVNEIYQDDQIQNLIESFNINSSNYPSLIKKYIEKTIAVELKGKVILNQKEKWDYVGNYKSPDGLINEIVLQNDKLYFRRKKAFMYEMVSESKTMFRLKGLVPMQQVSFKKNREGEIKNLIHFDGKSNAISQISK